MMPRALAAAASRLQAAAATRSLSVPASISGRSAPLASCRHTSGMAGLRALRRSSATRRALTSRYVPTRSALHKADGWEPTWKQSTDEVTISLPIPDEVKGRDIQLDVHPKRMTLSINGSEVIGGNFLDSSDQPLVTPDGCFWNIEDNNAMGRYVQIVLEKKEIGYESWDELFEGEGPNMEFTNIVYLDVQIADKTVGKIVIGLYGHIAPKTCVNFLELCKGSTKSRNSGNMLTYKGSPFHRIIPGFMAQGGDITMGNGTGGESIYGDKFEDENFTLKHDSAGILSMANAGPDTNGSQFFLLFDPQPHLDGKHTVFGKVLDDDSMKVLRQMETLGTPDGTPKAPMLISSCGEAITNEGDPMENDPEVAET